MRAGSRTSLIPVTLLALFALGSTWCVRAIYGPLSRCLKRFPRLPMPPESPACPAGGRGNRGAPWPCHRPGSDRSNDENGQVVKLRDFFNKGRPVLLDLVYSSNCPQLRTLILNRQVKIMRQMTADASRQTARYEIVRHQHRSARDPGNRQPEESDLPCSELRKAGPGLALFSPIATTTAKRARRN